MDNNNYNNNDVNHSSNTNGTGNVNNSQNGDSFYSYGSQNYGNNSQSYQNQNYQNNSNQTYGSQTYGGQTYSNQSYSNQTYTNQTYQQATPPKKEKKKRERKPGGFGTKIAKCAALALVFGLVSGVVFEGVHLTSGAIFGTEEQASTSSSVLTKADSSGSVQATATSSTYAAADISDVVSEVMPSIVAITNVSQQELQSFWGSQTYESTSCGSGIIVSQDDNNLYIATNNHVVNGADSLTVTFADNSTVTAEVKGTDPSTDLAVVSVALANIESDTMSSIKVATLGSSSDLKVGEASIAIGNALGYGQSVTTGVISALNREVTVSDSSSDTAYTAELIQTDAAINPGNSGGALLNALGEVIGINSVKYSDTDVEGIGYAIPIDTAMPIIEDLITKEKVDESDSAYLGVAGVDVSDDVSNTYNMPTGVYVAQVMEGSAAEKAGICKGDIITQFDGKDITSMEELSDRMQYYAAGTTVDVVVMRSSNGEYVENTISVTLGKKN